MAVDVITSEAELRAVEGEWEALWRADTSATPFQSPHWLVPWWEEFGSGELAALAVRQGGVLSGLVPLYIVRDDDADESLGMFIGTGVSDYLDALGTPDLTELHALDCQIWHLQGLRTSSALLTCSAPAGWADTFSDDAACPFLNLSEFERRTSKGFHKKLRYYRGLLRRHAPLSVVSASTANLDHLLGALFELHAARWAARGLPGVLADQQVQRFHRKVARRMLLAGALRMHALQVDERIAAVFYGFAQNDVTYYYLSGYDPAFQRFSIGMLLVSEAIDRAREEGHAVFDFLRGAEEYKYAWGAMDRMTRTRVMLPGSRSPVAQGR
jgi:CelD/BcsL family acetyltransferase involved in cellulose biosynthesis